jgi:hypothetical protein
MRLATLVFVGFAPIARLARRMRDCDNDDFTSLQAIDYRIRETVKFMAAVIDIDALRRSWKRAEIIERSLHLAFQNVDE